MFLFFFSYLFFDPFNFFNFLLFMRFMAQIEEVKKKDLRENSALVIAFLFFFKIPRLLVMLPIHMLQALKHP